MPNEAYGKGIYLSILILSRHWRFELRAKGSRVWIWTKTPADCEEKGTGVDRFDLKYSWLESIVEQNHFYPAIEGACANTKIW
jgi:hypothetical protein